MADNIDKEIGMIKLQLQHYDTRLFNIEKNLEKSVSNIEKNVEKLETVTNNKLNLLEQNIKNGFEKMEGTFDEVKEAITISKGFIKAILTVAGLIAFATTVLLKFL